MYTPICAVFRRFLKRQGLKFTPERARILDAVLSKDDVFDADQLFYEMHHGDTRVSKATIYRTLKHLLEASILDEVLIDSKHAHYRLSLGRETKAHLVCIESHRIIEFEAPELAPLRDRICREHGFDPVGSRFVVYGVSPEAGQEDATPEAAPHGG